MRIAAIVFAATAIMPSGMGADRVMSLEDATLFRMNVRETVSGGLGRGLDQCNLHRDASCGRWHCVPVCRRD